MQNQITMKCVTLSAGLAEQLASLVSSTFSLASVPKQPASLVKLLKTKKNSVTENNAEYLKLKKKMSKETSRIHASEHKTIVCTPGC